MINNENYLELLNWGLPKEIQEKNITILANNKEINNQAFVQQGDKGCWLNEVKVLEKRGYPYISDVIPQLFEHLQDINWPGSRETYQLLLSLPRDVFIKNLELSVEKAINTNDESWLGWMYKFIIDLDIKKEEFIKEENYIILKNNNEYYN